VATTASESAIELLKRVPLFAELSPEELRRVSQVAIPRRFPGDTRVFHEGDEGDACYIVQSGACRVTREHRDGRAITLANLGPGAIFGELAMFDGGVRSASVEAVEDTQLLALPASDMRALIREHPGMAEKLVVALTKRLRAANERISRQSFQTVPSRVAGVLRQLLTEDEVATDRQGGVTIRLRQADLAQLAGTSRESVSRFLATLERAGVVRVGRARVTVIEPDRLGSYIF
jgi:CRP/FNR family transcriptional regulator